MPVVHSADTIAKLLNITRRRVQQLASDGVIPKPDNGKYHVINSLIGYIRYLQAKRNRHSKRD